MRSILLLVLNTCLSVLLMTVTGYAQNNNSGSPYSVYGPGTITNAGLIQLDAMGGAKTAFQSPVLADFNNPASLAALRITNFNFGLDGRMLRLSDGSSELDKSSFNLSYFNLSFPIGKKMGAGVGLTQFSNVDYSVLRQFTTDIVREERFQGIGGLNRSYASFGWQPFKSVADSLFYKNLSFGAGMDFFFGNLNESQFIVFPDDNNSLNLRTNDFSTIYGVGLNYGLQYKLSHSRIKTVFKDSIETKIKKDNVFYFGFTHALPTSLRVTRSQLAERYLPSFNGSLSVIDTIYSLNTKSRGENGMTLPSRISIGAGALLNQKVYLAGDFNIGGWSDYTFLGRSDKLVNNMGISFGGFYQPVTLDKFKTGDNYWNIVKYRFGMRYDSGNLLLSNQEIQDVGITFGLSLPLRGAKGPAERFSSLNLAVELGQRGTFEADLLRERYVNLKLGISLVDRWFIKRKYD